MHSQQILKLHATGGAANPAYVRVSVPNLSDKMLSHDGADDILEPGILPPSLYRYVERTLIHCKGGTQMAACQIVLKGTIIKTIADGTLYTRDWDIEPLFPLPDTDAVNNNIENKGQHVFRLEKFDSEFSCHGY